MSGKPKKKAVYRHEAAMQAPNSVTMCLRMPAPLHEKLIEVQAKHMEKTGSAVSRNTLILAILSRHVESGRGIEV